MKNLNELKEVLSPQNKTLLTYLEGGRHITQLIALSNLGLGSLTSRVSQLRKALLEHDLPYEIAGDWKEDFSGQSYKSYSLIEKKK